MRESWTDERLDDFRAETARRFGDVDRRFDEVDRRFDAVDRRFDSLERKMDDKMEKGFARLDGRIDALNRTLLQIGGGVIVALIGLIATQL